MRAQSEEGAAGRLTSLSVHPTDEGRPGGRGLRQTRRAGPCAAGKRAACARAGQKGAGVSKSALCEDGVCCGVLVHQPHEGGGWRVEHRRSIWAKGNGSSLSTGLHEAPAKSAVRAKGGRARGGGGAPGRGRGRASHLLSRLLRALAPPARSGASLQSCRARRVRGCVGEKGPDPEWGEKRRGRAGAAERSGAMGGERGGEGGGTVGPRIAAANNYSLGTAPVRDPSMCRTRGTGHGEGGSRPVRRMEGARGEIF